MNNILKILEQINAYKNYSHDEKGLGELFADIYKDKCRYNTTTKCWFIYNGRIWEEDKGNLNVSRYAKELSKCLLQYAKDIKYSQYKETYINFMKKLGNLNKRKTMVEDARDKYPISNEQLDTDAYLFNCLNGTYNLKTFTLQTHNPKDLISKISNVRYDENAESIKFQKFIEEIMENDTEKINYLQKILGYSLTGDTMLEELYIFYGPSTRNGKSTLVEAIVNMLGGTKGYAITVNPESFAYKQFSDSRQASGDIARLKGYRFANANEVPQNMKLNSNLLKTLTGRDTITAREIYQTSFDFKVSFKLFFNTNYLPLIEDNTMSTSNRIKVITFNRHFTEEEQNKKLKEELANPDVVSAIFNWCIEGLKKFNCEGANPPKEIINEILEYQCSNDILQNFIDECLVQTKSISQAKDIYEQYKEWLNNNGYTSETKQQFFLRLKTKNLLTKQGTVNGKTVKNVIVGYEVRSKL